jgi:hypothetical protein
MYTSDITRYPQSNRHKTLNDLVNALLQVNPDSPISFRYCGTPSLKFVSYRGYYQDLAVTPGESGTVTVNEFIFALHKAVGQIYVGWKGGDFVADLDSPLWVVVSASNIGEFITEVTVESDGSVVIESESDV